MANQNKIFWESEVGSRTRTLPFSVVEQYQLRNMFPDHLQGPIRKVLSAFGKSRGTGLATNTLLHFVRGNKEWAAGQAVSPAHHFFPVLKHVLAVALKMKCENPSVFRASPTRGITCECLPMTSMMPKLCQHNGGIPLTYETPFEQTLCSTCTSCMRCGKVLACINEWPRVGLLVS